MHASISRGLSTGFAAGSRASAGICSHRAENGRGGGAGAEMYASISRRLRTGLDAGSRGSAGI
eukprot:115005-Chlamydomonas_euryale.AAC.1